MGIEYADVDAQSLPETLQCYEPFSHENLPSEDRMRDWSLEDCISIGLQNAKMLISTPGLNLQSGSMASSISSAQPGQVPSVYDPALVALTGSSQPLAIDGQGNRIAPRGSVRANQVGGVEQALSEFDAQYSAIFGYNTTDRPRNVGQGNVFNPQLFKATDASLQNAISKRLATGTVVTARTNTVYSRNNVPASFNSLFSSNFGRAVPSDYTASLEFQINQPLMRGRGALVNRIPVLLARANEENATHQFEANVRNLLRDIEHAYWDLYGAYRNVKVSQDAYEFANRLWRVAQARSESSETTPAAVAQAFGRVAQFKAQLHIAIHGSPIPGNDQLGLIGRERVLREKLGLVHDGWFIRPSDIPTQARVHFDWETAKGEMLSRNTELRISKWNIKQRELEHISAKNQLLPQLDLVGTYRFLGVGDNLISADRTGLTFPNPGSNAFENLTSGDFQEVTARLELTPARLGARGEKANINATLFGLKKAHEELKIKETATELVLSQAWSNLHSTFISAIDFADQMQAHMAEIKSYNDLIDEKTGELNVLLDQMLRAEEFKARAEQQFNQSVVEYNKSIVNIHYIKGSIFDLNNVSLGEGAWVEKAYWDAEQRAEERAGGLYFDYGYTRPSVMSRGPVESGGATESNISDTTPRSSAPIIQPSDVNDADEDKPKKGSILNNEDSDTKSTLRLQEGNQQPSLARPTNNQPSSVRPASSEAKAFREDQFQWGEIEQNLNRKQLQPVSGNNLKQVPNTSRTMQAVQPVKAELTDRAIQPTNNLPANDLRSTPVNKQRQESTVAPATNGQAPSASIQWKPRN
jgi:Outer membrane efflux protein